MRLDDALHAAPDMHVRVALTIAASAIAAKSTTVARVSGDTRVHSARRDEVTDTYVVEVHWTEGRTSVARAVGNAAAWLCECHEVLFGPTSRSLDPCPRCGRMFAVVPSEPGRDGRGVAFVQELARFHVWHHRGGDEPDEVVRGYVDRTRAIRYARGLEKRFDENAYVIDIATLRRIYEVDGHGRETFPP